LFLVDGCRDGLWGWFIYDVCVAGVEGDVLHASSSRIRNLFGRAGFVETSQKVYHGLAPFLSLSPHRGVGSAWPSVPT